MKTTIAQKEMAQAKGWASCVRVAESEDCCLPTACGYQFVEKEGALNFLDVNPFFAMDGLGLAQQIEHGIGHHFMGAMFSHHSCICVCTKKEIGCCSISNLYNNFLIFGWGTSG